jgi:hypothetical protein
MTAISSGYGPCADAESGPFTATASPFWQPQLVDVNLGPFMPCALEIGLHRVSHHVCLILMHQHR